ncbi:MAG TPA: hypothetical protein DDW45_05965 [Gammaproteobacteria bacterium]|nr:hypothetical protein [Gammaproteobacteria bacterium]
MNRKSLSDAPRIVHEACMIKSQALSISGNKIRIGIDAPWQIPGHREEKYLQVSVFL